MRVVFSVRVALATAAVLGAVGCNQNPFGGPSTIAPTGTLGRTPVDPQVLAAQKQRQEAGDRFRSLQSDHQQLETMLAQSRQQSAYLKEQAGALREQLKDTTDKLSRVENDKVAGDRRIESLQASAQKTTSAFKPNNSATRKLKPIRLTGVEVRTDGDVVRVELPVEKLFDPDSDQLTSRGKSLIDSVMAELERQYRDQIIGVEGHTDLAASGPGGNWRGYHDLAAAQATAVFDHLTGPLRIDAQQLSIVGHGSNFPLVSNGTGAGRKRNRRVELVIYPERYR